MSKQSHEQEQRTRYESALGRAHNREVWGAYEVLVFFRAAHTYETVEFGTGRKRTHKARDTYQARAYLGTACVYGNKAFQYPTEKKALTGLRQSMRKSFDLIPDRIDKLEAEYARLSEILRG